MVDAECPRCGTTSLPPEAGLVTCKRCALVYPPHEVQRKIARSVEPDYPAPPASVDAFLEGDAVIVRWPLARYIGVFLISIAVLLAVPIREVTHWYARAPFMAAMAVALYYAAIQLLGSHQLAITAEGVSHHVPFALLPTVRIPAANLRAVAVIPTQLGGELHVRSKSRRARTRITRGTDRVALRYAAQLIAAKLALPLED